jgi:hypothetical protein
LGRRPKPDQGLRAPGPRQDLSWTLCLFVRYAVKQTKPKANVCLMLRDACLDKRQVLLFARFWCFLATGAAHYGTPKETPWTSASKE